MVGLGAHNSPVHLYKLLQHVLDVEPLCSVQPKQQYVAALPSLLAFDAVNPTVWNTLLHPFCLVKFSLQVSVSPNWEEGAQPTCLFIFGLASTPYKTPEIEVKP